MKVVPRVEVDVRRPRFVSNALASHHSWSRDLDLYTVVRRGRRKETLYQDNSASQQQTNRSISKIKNRIPRRSEIRFREVT
jgi:hypothetical protein